MDISFLFKKLNSKQKEAVMSKYNRTLILAGAGSGKTRVLIYRILWLLKVKKYPSSSFITVTFTNKAAEEIRHRIKKIFNKNQDKMWIGTFHGIANKILRIHYKNSNLPKNFQIIDKDDQLRLIKRVMKNMNIDEKKWTYKQVICFINNKKNQGLYPINLNNNDKLSNLILKKIYDKYQKTCNLSGLVDFSELLLRAYNLWKKNPEILDKYRKKFKNILVDEFQDTNKIQYKWIRLLAGKYGKIMVVGDDDQSIYGWRGAKLENINKFINDFSDLNIIRLEQNYRSTSNILKAANYLISHNNKRFIKNLWTNSSRGKLITLYCANNENDEAQFIVNKIKTKKKKYNKSLKDFAILYRNNAQSRVIEEELLKNKLPYYIYSGIRFFERKEIKDILSYLRLIINLDDDSAYERIINIPSRGIGECTFKKILKFSKEKNLTLWKSSIFLINNNLLSDRAIIAIKNFLKLILKLKKDIKNLTPKMQIILVIERSGIKKMYQKEKKKEKRNERIENISELVTALHNFSLKNKEKFPLKSFISYASLEENNKNNINAIQLMTLHAAKGLEFPQVFIIGMEEGIFPSIMSLENNINLEEERRLAYVGITRAMEKLTITYAKIRFKYGKENLCKPSRFIDEIPLNCIKLEKKKYLNNKFNYYKNNKFIIGQKVFHNNYGKGIIIKIKKNNTNNKLKILFQGKITKWLVTDYARLDILS